MRPLLVFKTAVRMLLSHTKLPRTCEPAMIGDQMSSLKHDGVCVVRRFISPEQVDNILSDLRNVPSDKFWKDAQGSDSRIFGAEKLSNNISSVLNAPLLDQIRAQFYSITPVGFAMYGALKFVTNNSGSGGGWHVDSYQRQLKFIIYLSDVALENGPFEYVIGSHKLSRKIALLVKNIFKADLSRFSENEVEAMLKTGDTQAFTGRAGDLLIVDTSGLHRGMPIRQGERFAITNYMWPRRIPQHIKAQMVKTDKDS